MGLPMLATAMIAPIMTVEASPRAERKTDIWSGMMKKRMEDRKPSAQTAMNCLERNIFGMAFAKALSLADRAAGSQAASATKTAMKKLNP